MITFPVSTAGLSDFLPHRGPALWVDEVSSVSDTEGVCRVFVRPEANYADSRGLIRDSSYVEWIAQAYGFVSACQILCGLVPDEKRPEKAFLVQVRDLELSEDPAATLIFEGDWLNIQVRRTHRMGPLALVEGAVFSSKGIALARAKLKLYAE